MVASREQGLVKRTLKGDLGAYGELVQAYQVSVFNVCFRILGNRQEAEDLTQDAFLRAYQHLSSYDPARPFGPWMRTLAANLCFNFLKRRGPIRATPEDEWDNLEETPKRNPEKALERSQEGQQVYQALWKLPPAQRLAVELRHFQDMSYQEMAETMNLPLNTVKSHLYRGRQTLADLLEEKDHES